MHVRADTYMNSPHIENGESQVQVVYNQQVNNKTVQKTVFVYRGPQLDEVRKELDRFLSEEGGKLSAVLQRGNERAVTDLFESNLRTVFAAQQDVLDAIQRD